MEVLSLFPSPSLSLCVCGFEEEGGRREKVVFLSGDRPDEAHGRGVTL